MYNPTQHFEMAMKTQVDLPPGVFISCYRGSFGLSFGYCSEKGKEYRQHEPSEGQPEQ